MDAAEDSAAADEQLFALQEEQEQRTENYDTSTSASGVDMKSLPAPLYTQNQRVYAKDEATGLLYPAMVRKLIWGPKSKSSLPVPALMENADNNDTNKHESMEDVDDEDDDQRNNPKLNCHHYYVHYMGWNVKWDRWVEEVYLYESSASTKLLADKIQNEYNKVKPRKKGQKMSVSQVRKWMKKVVELELEFRRLEREGKLVSVEKADEKDKEDGDEKESTKDGKEKGGSEPAESKAKDKKAKPKGTAKPIIKEEWLQKQAQLRQRGLQLKRKRVHADRLHLPFTIKKILVEEWEVIVQCGMLYDLPSKVSVRDILNSYLESKVAPMREKEGLKGDKTSSFADKDNDKMEVDNDEQQSAIDDREKEWRRMIDGIMLLFDQALPVHLLFEQERTQYISLRRQVLAQRRNAANNVQAKNTTNGSNENEASAASSDSQVQSTSSSDVPESKPLPDRMSEIYGCEHLLRLFIRLPAVVAETPSISEPDARRIFSKLGDLVRYIQKHQSELFKSTFRRPLQNEISKVVKEKSAADN